MSRRRAMALIVLGAVLAGMVTLMLPVQQWRTGRLEVPPLALQPGAGFAEAATRIWIDTDAACGADRTTDPDDCLALLLMATTPQLRIAGISTVAGNASLDVTDRTTRELVRILATERAMPAVHKGAHGAAALRATLREAELTILALGPLTNVAAALADRVDLQRRVTRVIAVMGRRPGHLFHPTEGAPGAMLLGHGPVFRDLNLVSDPQAAAAIVRMRVPLVLVPYDAARHVELKAPDLERLGARGAAGAWVAERTTGWLEYWRADVGREGFYPFDLMAAAFAMRPELFRCASVPVRIGEDLRFRGPFRRAPALLAGSDALTGSTPENTLAIGAAVYCPTVAMSLPRWLPARLAGEAHM
jgi:purine nucleosidase